MKKKRAPTALTLRCDVCTAPAPDHFHFGGHCCYSCRAFFRRTIERLEKADVVCKIGGNICEVGENSKSCSACRYTKCLEIGMKKELLQGKRPNTSLNKTEAKKQKITKEPKSKKRKIGTNGLTPRPSSLNSEEEQNPTQPMSNKTAFVKTSVIRHSQLFRQGNDKVDDYPTVLASKQKTETIVKHEIDEMFDHYVGSVPVMPYIEVPVIVAERQSSRFEVNQLPQVMSEESKFIPHWNASTSVITSSPPSTFSRLQNQVVTETQNLLESSSYERCINDYFRNHYEIY